MENLHQNYNEEDSNNKNKLAVKSENNLSSSNQRESDTSTTIEKQNADLPYSPNSTTGSGYSEEERNIHDGTNSRNPVDPQDNENGSQKLVDDYNINDKAHSDSSEEDFIKTTSNFNHAKESDNNDNKNNGI